MSALFLWQRSPEDFSNEWTQRYCRILTVNIKRVNARKLVSMLETKGLHGLTARWYFGNLSKRAALQHTIARRHSSTLERNATCARNI
jgi:hypothetical protein